MIRAVLPGALIAPPVRRGDLYRYRLLNASVFVVLDGVFANTLAVSPREVVDVIEDGAAFFGAASMGALRAADCAPAGAIGFGIIYRLFHARAISSEDEVAVGFLPERPWPALGEPLINFRIAARRAVRRKVLGPKAARALVEAAAAIPYADRTWDGAARAAGVVLSPGQLDFLKLQDAKRADAIGCCRMVARRLRQGRVRAGPRTDGKVELGRLGVDRERPVSPYPRDDLARIRPHFLKWLWLTGRFEHLYGFGCSEGVPPAVVASGPEALTFELGALAMRFAAFRMAVARARLARLAASAADNRRAEQELLQAHRAGSWTDLTARYEIWPEIRTCLARHKAARALSLAAAGASPSAGHGGGVPDVAARLEKTAAG